MQIPFIKKHPYLWKFFRKKTWAVLATCLILFAQTALSVFLPLPVGFIFDKIIRSSPGAIQSVVLKGISFGEMESTRALIFLSVLGFAAGLTLLVFQWLEAMITSQTVYNLSEEIRRDLFRKIFTRKQSYLDSKKKVDLMGRISADVSNLEIIFVTGIRAVVNSVPTIISMMFMMIAINLPFTLRFAMALPLLLGILYYFSKKQRHAQKLYRRKTVVFEYETHEAISSMAIVKSFRGEDKILDKLLTRTLELKKETERTRNAVIGLDTSTDTAYTVIRAILIFLGSMWVFQGRLSVGDLLIFMSYLSSIMKPINDIIKYIEKYPKCAVSMERIEEMNRELDENPEVYGDKIPDISAAEKSGSFLTFKDLSFQYSDNKKLFDRFNVAFQPKSLIAMVGQSGVGKSSFSRLLNRIQDPQSGAVLLGNIDLREFDIKALRKNIRVLTQDPFLIAGTVRENLSLSCAGAVDDAAIEKALDAVNALDFVKAFPQGLDTQIGEGGQQISGGQAKRIHLARAFLDEEAAIFLLDEPTTGLDPITAQRVIKSVQELSRQRSLVIWITHRMEEVHLANKVLFFSADNNPVLSTHEELFKTNNLYRALIEKEEKEVSPQAWNAEPLELAEVVE